MVGGCNFVEMLEGGNGVGEEKSGARLRDETTNRVIWGGEMGAVELDIDRDGIETDTVDGEVAPSGV